MNGLIVEVTTDKPLRGQLPHWDLIYKLPRDRLRFRQTLRAIKNLFSASRERTQVGEQEPIPIRRRAFQDHFRGAHPVNTKAKAPAVQEYLDQAYQTNQIPTRAKASQVLDLSLLDSAPGKK